MNQKLSPFKAGITNWAPAWNEDLDRQLRWTTGQNTGAEDTERETLIIYTREANREQVELIRKDDTWGKGGRPNARGYFSKQNRKSRDIRHNLTAVWLLRSVSCFNSRAAGGQRVTSTHLSLFESHFSCSPAGDSAFVRIMRLKRAPRLQPLFPLVKLSLRLKIVAGHNWATCSTDRSKTRKCVRHRGWKKKKDGVNVFSRPIPWRKSL